MSAISSYARALAVDGGRAFPIATRRHVHIAGEPLVLIPLTMAGEANAPLAAMVGTRRDDPALLIVPQPRNRDLRFAFADELAAVVLRYVEDRTRQGIETYGKNQDPRYLDAPQLLVPNPGGVGFVRLFGRSTRFRRTTGEYAVSPDVPLLGRWLSFLAERAEHPGSSALLPMTSALNLHWATGQSSLEDTNLAATLGWITSGPDAAREAEDPTVWPPAGPSTDPTFDNEILAPALRQWDEGRHERARALLDRDLRTQLEPTWRLMWQAIDLLRALPAGDSVDARWTEDRNEFTSYYMYVNSGGYPQPRRDQAVAAARRLQRLEREQTAFDATLALDDPLVMANYRVTGEAFAGTVVESEPDRKVPGDKGRRVLRPLLVVRSDDPLRLTVGTDVVSPGRRKQVAKILEIDGDRVTLQIEKGMTVAPTPAVGEEITYTSVFPEGMQSPKLPTAEDTPWTHGGPPQPYVASDDDAREVWE
ncbi:hypothetical protein JIG36_36695 [Actinoplanes sp. LDG1-06]|uniref:Uncharacterized protein n=1 Tax=Paractinoplanes ovalisporus TaxID=2810368 RepID=A0ABS2AMK3_9ACTN|nr:hypothetical protein [Actinoplanes ovalisporus]MBM2621054.1 hypothetical protein [Actinoplanes ovalisporus]